MTNSNLPVSWIAALGVAALEEEALDLVRDVADGAVLLVQRCRCTPSAGRAGRRRTACRRARALRRTPAPCRGRRRRTAASRRPASRCRGAGRSPAAPRSRGSSEPSKVRLSADSEQELLVVVEHVQAAFEVAEAHGDRLDALLVGQVLHALLAELVGLLAVEALLLGLEVHLLELVVGDLEEVAQAGLVEAERLGESRSALVRGPLRSRSIFGSGKY